MLTEITNSFIRDDEKLHNYTPNCMYLVGGTPKRKVPGTSADKRQILVAGSPGKNQELPQATSRNDLEENSNMAVAKQSSSSDAEGQQQNRSSTWLFLHWCFLSSQEENANDDHMKRYRGTLARVRSLSLQWTDLWACGVLGRNLSNPKRRHLSLNRHGRWFQLRKHVLLTILSKQEIVVLVSLQWTRKSPNGRNHRRRTYVILRMLRYIWTGTLSCCVFCYLTQSEKCSKLDLVVARNSTIPKRVINKIAERARYISEVVSGPCAIVNFSVKVHFVLLLTSARSWMDP